MDSVYDLFPVTQVLAVLAIIKTKDKLLSMLMLIDSILCYISHFHSSKFSQELRYCLYNPCKIMMKRLCTEKRTKTAVPSCHGRLFCLLNTQIC